jgi:hypothetical protein
LRRVSSTGKSKFHARGRSECQERARPVAEGSAVWIAAMCVDEFLCFLCAVWNFPLFVLTTLWHNNV